MKKIKEDIVRYCFRGNSITVEQAIDKYSEYLNKLYIKAKTDSSVRCAADYTFDSYLAELADRCFDDSKES